MIKSKFILILLVGVILISFSCAPRVAQTPETKTVGKPEMPVEKVSWLQEWENLVKAAQKEGKLTFYSGMEPEAVRAMRKHFGEKYGIDLENTTGQPAQLSPKIYMERQVGLYIPDLYVEGPSFPFLELKPRGLIKPLDPVVFRPDVLDEKVWALGFGAYFDKDHFIGGGMANVNQSFTINKKMVGPEELTSYNDVLNPKWKGKIIMVDPMFVGGARTNIESTLIIMGEDYIRKLREQVGIITSDKRLAVEWLVKGKYPIAFSASSAILEEFIKEGVDWVEPLQLKEGGYISSTGAVVLFDRAPHPDAARLFINWFLTKEGQEIYAAAAARVSRRLDASTDHLQPYQKLIPGVRYVVQDEEFYLKRQERMPIIEKYYKQ